MTIVTGWFGVPGGSNATKTHVVVDEKPICGARLRQKSEFQFCSAGVWSPMVECRRCLKMSARLIEAERRATEAAAALRNGAWRKRA